MFTTPPSVQNPMAKKVDVFGVYLRWVLGCPGMLEVIDRINGDRINGLLRLLINGVFVGVMPPTDPNL